MQKAVVLSLSHDSEGYLREIPVCVTVDPPDAENRRLNLSAVSHYSPPFNAITLDLVQLLEALEELGEPEVQGVSAAYSVQAMKERVDDIERRLDNLFDSVHHGGDD